MILRIATGIGIMVVAVMAVWGFIILSMFLTFIGELILRRKSTKNEELIRFPEVIVGYLVAFLILVLGYLLGGIL